MLKLGAKGAEVIELQTLLKKHYPDIVVDGDFGPKTEAYLKIYQGTKGLVADGIAGPMTKGSLKGTPITPPIVVEPSPGGVNLGDNKFGKKYPGFAYECKSKMVTRGTYAKGWPLGATVHFTAGRDGAEKTINGGIGNGYTYWCIQKDGKLFVAHDANKWGYHAGAGRWERWIPWLKGSLNDDLIGIEINAAGRLTKEKDGTFTTWFKTKVPADQVRYVDGSSPDQCEGYYEKYTPAQEETLINTLLWLKAQNPDVFSFDAVLGHSEISGKLGVGKWLKNDPSGALSMTMPQLRQLLKAKWAALHKG